MIKELKIAILGFGNVGCALARLLIDKEDEILSKYDYRIRVVAIATKSRGSIVDEEGIDLESALSDMKDLRHFDSDKDNYSDLNSMDIAEKIDYDLLLELTPLEIFSGQPAIDHIKSALNRGKHVVSANKGPVAWAYKELKDLAGKQKSLFYYETTVMDGTPVFNLASETLDLCKVTEVNGILNTTTNFILGEITKGRDYDEVMAEGRKRGFIEADSAMDIEGWDAAAKTAVLLNVLMNADITPIDIERKGIEDISIKDIEEADKRGNVIKLMCHGSIRDGRVIGRVEPREIPRDNIYSNIKGTSSIVTIKTDLMGELSIVEHNPEIEQTAYGVFSDLLRVIRNM